MRPSARRKSTTLQCPRGQGCGSRVVGWLVVAVFLSQRCIIIAVIFFFGCIVASASVLPLKQNKAGLGLGLGEARLLPRIGSSSLPHGTILPPTPRRTAHFIQRKLAFVSVSPPSPSSSTKISESQPRASVVLTAKPRQFDTDERLDVRFSTGRGEMAREGVACTTDVINRQQQEQQ